MGIVLATQNPIDVDYKGLGNIGTWMVGRLQTDNDRARLRDGLIGAGVDVAAVDVMLGAARKRVFLLHDVHRPKPCLLASRFVMSFRGPLTREEISRRMAEHGATATVAPTATRDEGATAPLLPPPFKHLYFSRYGAAQAEPHLLVKYANRLKDQDQTIGSRLYPLGVASPSEILDAEHLDIESEDLISATVPEGVRYGDLPAFLASAGAKGIERAIKDRLADEFKMTVLLDKVSRMQSEPGESVEEFERRLESSVSSAEAERLRERLQRKQRDLQKATQDLEGRGQEKKAAMLRGAIEVGASLFGSLFSGRGSSAASTLRKGALTYSNSNLDLMTQEGIINFREIIDNKKILGNKNINHINFDRQYAYLSTAFGLVQFDVRKQEFGFTTFTDFQIRDTAILDNFIWMATDQGLYRSPLNNANLADLSLWEKLDERHGLRTINIPVTHLVINKKNLYIVFDQKIWRWDGNQFSLVFELKDYHINYISDDAEDLIVGLRCVTGQTQ